MLDLFRRPPPFHSPFRPRASGRSFPNVPGTQFITNFAGLAQDNAGATPAVSTGQRVRFARAQKGGSASSSNITAAYKLQSLLGKNNAICFGPSNVQGALAFPCNVSNVFTLCLRFRAGFKYDFRVLVGMNSGSIIIGQAGAAGIGMYDGVNGLRGSGATYSDDTDTVLTVISDGTTAVFRVNRVQVGSCTTLPSVAGTNAYIGSCPAGPAGRSHRL